MTAIPVLRKCQMFAALNDAQLKEIIGLATEKEYEAGTIIFEQGDSAEEFFVLQEGKVAVQMTLPTASAQTNKRVTTYFVTKNEVLGWSAILGPHVYTLSAVSLEKTRVLAIDGGKLRALLQRERHLGHEVLQNLIKVVSSRLCDTIRVLANEQLVTPKAE